MEIRQRRELFEYLFHLFGGGEEFHPSSRLRVAARYDISVFAVAGFLPGYELVNLDGLILEGGESYDIAGEHFLSVCGSIGNSHL